VEGSRLRYQDGLAGYVDKWLFVVCFAVGLLAMFALKQAKASQWFVTALPVVSMLVYGGYVLWNPSLKLRGDKGGDSIYYLGFLFTMVSLAFALWEYAPGQGAQVVRNFGVALSTTIAGLVLRVLYHQLREDPLESDAIVRADLSEVVRALRDEMLVALRDFGTLRAAVVQSLEEVTNSTASAVRAATTAAVTDTVTAVKLSGASATENAKQLLELTGGVIADSRRVQSAMRRQSQATVKAFETLVARIEATDLPTERVAVKLNAVAEQFDGVIRKLADAEQIHERRYKLQQGVLDNIGKTIGSMKSNVDQVATALESQRAAAQSAAVEWQEAVGTVSRQVVTVAESLKGVDAVMRASASAMNQAVAKELQLVAQHRAALEKEVRACDELVASVRTGLIGMSNFIVEKTRA
jgi:hypothetical protein